MVTCKIDSKSKMSRSRKSSSTSSGFCLLDRDQQDTVSSVSRNSYYKLKIDSMFDESRSVISRRLDDRLGSRRTGSIIMYGKCEINNNNNNNNRSFLRDDKNNHDHHNINSTVNHQDDIRKIGNSVQAQIERMFTDVVKDNTIVCSFPVRCLGSLILQKKVTNLQGLQEPLRQLYLGGTGQGGKISGYLDICPNMGLRIRTSVNSDPLTTPFYNIAVWSALKFVISPSEGGAAFLPLITDPEYIDKTSLFRPLTAADQRRLSSDLHAPIFVVVMRSSGIPKLLECHGFICQTSEDAIVIAASLYQSLMSHVNTNFGCNSKRRTPRNQNGISCISIASSVLTEKNNTSQLPNYSIERKVFSSNKSSISATKSVRKKRVTPTTLTNRDAICEMNKPAIFDEYRKKLCKNKRITSVPSNSTNKSNSDSIIESSLLHIDKQQCTDKNIHLSKESIYHTKDGTNNGDILTRVAIPRSGSFLNTSGLTRYKSHISRRNCGKIGGGGGSPLGFNELFNEFKLHENLHSLDEILNAIIDADGMSFNDLKPIYKEFLLKLAVTLTKDELYQRSKNIMRRQKKKKLRRRQNNCVPKTKSITLTASGLKNVFWFGHFRSCKFRRLSKSFKTKHFGANKTKQIKNQDDVQNGTSGSDLSDLRNDNILNGLNRNSSSGYVSCSECSYDSEACTCTSADRCYCSLGANNHNRVNDDKINKSTVNRDSLITCKTEDKCYCSMDETVEDTSEATYCDSDSCNSNSKCYCKKRVGKKQSSSSKWNEKNKKLGLDYELFTVGCSQIKSVKSHEALSAKKSAEAAALFADIKVVQTTDIKSFQNSKFIDNKNDNKQSEQKLIANQNEKNYMKRLNSNNDLNSNKSDDIIVTDNKQKKNSIITNNVNHQSTKMVSSASLEDSLGYLP